MNKKSLFWLSFVAVFTLFVWKRVIGLALVGEGPTYFAEPYVSMISNEGIVTISERHDVGALLFFNVAKNFFGSRHVYYMLVLLIGEIVVVSSLFIVIRKLSGSDFAATLSSIMFASNYVGSYEMLGLGYYQWFIQRVPYFALTLISFLYLHKFLVEKKINYYLVSIFLYSFALFLAHYSMLIIPLILIYPFAYLISNKFHLKDYLKSIFFVAPYLFVTYLLIKNQPIKAEMGLFVFLKNMPNIFQIIIREITILTIPVEIIKKVLIFLNSNVIAAGVTAGISISLETFINIVGILLFVLMVVLATKTYVKESNKRPLLLAVFLSIFPITFMAVYLNPYFYKFFDSSRYLYLSSMFVAAFWGITLSFYGENSVFKKFIVVFLFSVFAIINIKTLNDKFIADQPKHKAVLDTFNFVRDYKFPSGSVVFVDPRIGYYGSEMMTYFYPDKTVVFYPVGANEKEIKNNSETSGETYRLWATKGGVVVQNDYKY